MDIYAQEKNLDLLLCFENHCYETVYEKLIDSAAVINKLEPREGRTFAEYADNVFLPYIQIQLGHVYRDIYNQNSLREGTRQWCWGAMKSIT